MKRVIFSVAFLGLLPFIAGAHGDKYLEFFPDRSSSLKVADVETPSQVFYAQNDFLGSFDFWVANPGSSGTATFSLLNAQGIVITSKTVTVPTIALTTDGTKFHVDLNSQLPVLADDKYSIRITTSMPDLYLYYANRVQLVSHNAPFVSPYVTGVAKLGNEEQIFSFKYALYETSESSAPIISNLAWSVLSESQMKVLFNANEAIDYKVEYGPSGYTQSTNFLGDYSFCTEGINDCSITVSVSPDTQYQYRLTVKDSWGNQSQATGTFTSGQAQTPSPTPTPTDEPPVISNLRVAEVSNNLVAIAWTSNEIANSFLSIYFSSDEISITAESDATFELEHLMETDPVLGAGAVYKAVVKSNDLGGNETVASISFTTLSGQPSPSPTPTPTPTGSPTNTPTPSPSPSPSTSSGPTPSASATPQSSPNSPSGETKIEWNPPSGGEPTDGYRIDVFDKDGKLVKTVYAPAGSNSAEIKELADGDYKVIVYENNGGVFKKVEQPKNIKVEPSFTDRLLGFWWVLIPLLAGLGFILFRNFKKASKPVS
jgi:hypothetical protein